MTNLRLLVVTLLTVVIYLRHAGNLILNSAALAEEAASAPDTDNIALVISGDCSIQLGMFDFRRYRRSVPGVHLRSLYFLYKIPLVLPLTMIATVLALSVTDSLLFPKAAEAELPQEERRKVLEEPLSEARSAQLQPPWAVTRRVK